MNYEMRHTTFNPFLEGIMLILQRLLNKPVTADGWTAGAWLWQ